MTLRARLFLLLAPVATWAVILLLINALTGCTPALLSAFGLAATAAAPAVGSALGAYAQAADDAQRAAQLPPNDPEVVALRSALAALAAADAKVEKAVQPVACIEPVPVGAPLPPPAVDQTALIAALTERVTRAEQAQAALVKVHSKRKPKAAPVVDAGADAAADAASEGGAL